MKYPRHPNMKISIKRCMLILKYIFYLIFIFGCRGYLINMQCGYGFNEELNYTSNKSPNSKFERTNKEICQKYDRKSYFFIFPLQNLELLFYRYNSCFIISLIRPNLDLKPPLMSMQNISFPSFFSEYFPSFLFWKFDTIIS